MTQPLTKYFLPHEEKQLLTTVKAASSVIAERDYGWMCLLRQTGLRVGSLARLTVFDATEALRIGYLFYIGKGNRPGKVFINKKAKMALKSLLAARQNMGYINDPDAPLIMSRNHNGIAIRTLQYRMTFWVEKAGLPLHASPHWWRHTMGIRIIERSTAKVPLLIVQSVLNHANIKNTAIYTRPGREQIEQSMEEAS